MIIALFNLYLALLFVLVKTKLVPWNWVWKLSPVLWLGVLLVGLFIPMGWGAPYGPALIARQSVQIVPSVAGEVIDVPVEPNAPLKAGDVLFRIDPVPYQAKVHNIQAQLKFAELRYGQMGQLQKHDAGRLFDVQQREAETTQLRAQLQAAKWDLEKTTVRAPADGYVTNLALRKGARVASLPLSPVMAFIDTSESIIGVELGQIYARYVAPGQQAELTFKFFPGKIFKGQVETVLQAISSGQIQPSGLAATPKAVEAGPFVARIKLDDANVASTLPAGTAGDAAIYTEHMKATHVIRRVMLRQIALLNYILPW
jgi:RND family efflux transporter MFP subunit